MPRLYKILYLLTSWIGTTAQATLLSVRLFRPLRASLPRKPIVGAGFPLRADPASSNFADPRPRAQGFALSLGLLRLAFLDAQPPSTPLFSIPLDRLPESGYFHEMFISFIHERWFS